MRLHIEKITFLLTLIWLPFSIGGVDYINELEFGGLGLEYFIILFVYLTSSLLYFSLGVKYVGLLSFLWVSSIGLSLLIYPISLASLSQFFSLSGALVLSYLYISLYNFSEFIRLMDKVFKFWLILSLGYILLNPSMSFSYVNDIFSASSFFGQKNVYGRFLMLALLFHCARFNFSDVALTKTSFYIWALLISFALYLSASKSAMALSVGIIIFYKIVSYPKFLIFSKRYSPYFYIIFFCSLILFLLSSNVAFLHIGTAIDCMSIFDVVCIPGTGRFTIWDALIFDVYLEGKEMYGYGYGVYFGGISDLSLANIGLGEFVPHDPHNGYIEFFANFGYIGLAFFSGLLLWVSILIRRCSDPEFKFFLIFFWIYLLANFTESYFLKTTNFYILLYVYMLGFLYRSRFLL